MTKKIVSVMMAIATLFATSCDKDFDSATPAGENAVVSFNVTTPQMGVRAFSDGETATVLQYAVYDAAGNELTHLTKTDGEIHGSAKVELQLVTGNTYSVIFWAAAPNAPYDVDFDAKTMTVDYASAVSNDENRDAFYAYHSFEVKGAQTETIELKRPFAQLNIGTNDYEHAAEAGYEPTLTSVKVPVSSELNFVTGAVNEAATVEFELAAIPQNEVFPVTGYDYMAMNYMLVPVAKQTVEVEFAYSDGVDAKTRKIGSVPVQRNYRTNIYGSILTSEVDVNVKIEPEYNKPDYPVEVWDGETLETPAYDATTNSYTVSHASQLAYIAALVNGTLPQGRSTAAPQSFDIVLTDDIDLGNNEWTPIGSATQAHGFTGNFDGNGYKIKNLNITDVTADADGYVYAGLFGITEGAQDNENTIKNLVIENVNISVDGHIVAAAIAYPYYTTVENVTVQGDINIKGKDYVAGVLGYTRRCVNAKNLTISGNAGSAITGNYTVGGVISDIQTNGGLVANYSNFNASGLTITANNKHVGGISGIIGNQTLDGATVENVTIVSDDARKGIVSGALGGKAIIKNVTYSNVSGATNVVGATYGNAAKVIVDGDVYNAYTVGSIAEIGGVKAVVYEASYESIKAVTVEHKGLNGLYWQDAMDWASGLGEGWALASIKELDAIHAVRVDLNAALKKDNANNALFEEEIDGVDARYMSSTKVPEGGSDANGNAYFDNRVFFKLFNDKGYSDVPYSAFDCINIYAPLKDFHVACGVIEL